MRRVPSLIAALFSLSVSFGEMIDLYLVWGQSNAKPQVGEGVQSVFDDTGLRSVVIVNRHGGAGISSWWNQGSPQYALLEDFAVVDAEMAKIRANGNEPRMAGLFICHGEANWSLSGEDQYTPRVRHVIAAYEDRYGLEANTLKFCVMVTDFHRTLSVPDGSIYTLAAAGIDEEIRPAQVAMAMVPQGSYLDSYGYRRRDFWHLWDHECYRLGSNMARAMLGVLEKRAAVSGIQGDLNGDFLIHYDAIQCIGEQFVVEESIDGRVWSPVAVSIPVREADNTLTIDPPPGVSRCLWRLRRAK